MNHIFSIDESKSIIYKINNLFKLDSETLSPYYQTEIIVPIKDIATINASEIHIYGTTKNWFKPNKIDIVKSSLKISNTNDWQSTDDLIPQIEIILSIEPNIKDLPIDNSNYLISKKSESFEEIEEKMDFDSK